VVINIRNDKSAIGECVNHVSGLFVDLDSVNISLFSGEPNLARVSREFPYPPEVGL